MGCSCSSLDDQACYNANKNISPKSRSSQNQISFRTQKNHFSQSTTSPDPTDKERIAKNEISNTHSDFVDDEFINLDHNFLENIHHDLGNFDPESFIILYQGTSSLIIKANKCGIPFAIKICKNIDTESTEYQYISKKPIEEAEIMNRCSDHPYIVRLFDYFKSNDKKRIYIIMEYCSKGTIEKEPHFSSKSPYYSSNVFSMVSSNPSPLSLFQNENFYLNNQELQFNCVNSTSNKKNNDVNINSTSSHKKFQKTTKTSHFSMCTNFSTNNICNQPADKSFHTEINITRAFVQILEAINYLHSNRIAHRDIKPSNILMDDKMNAKLADFGTAIRVPRQQKSNLIPVNFNGTFSYFPPEIFKETHFDPFLADIWSLGVTLYQLSFGHLPFGGNNLEEKALEIREKEVEFPEFVEQKDPDLVDLIRKMLNKDPGKRIKVSAIWNHPFIFRGMKISPKKSSSLSNFSSAKVRRSYFSLQLR